MYAGGLGGLWHETEGCQSVEEESVWGFLTERAPGVQDSCGAQDYPCFWEKGLIPEGKEEIHREKEGGGPGMSDERQCVDCKHCYSTADGARFLMYWCYKKPGLVVGESNYLDGFYSASACNEFEPLVGEVSK